MRRSDNLTTFMCRLSWNLGASTSWNPQGLSRPVMGLLYLYSLATLKTLNTVTPLQQNIMLTGFIHIVTVQYSAVSWLLYLSTPSAAAVCAYRWEIFRSYWHLAWVVWLIFPNEASDIISYIIYYRIRLLFNATLKGLPSFEDALLPSVDSLCL